MIIGSVIGGLAGARLQNRLRGPAVRKVIAVILVLAGVLLVVTA